MTMRFTHKVHHEETRNLAGQIFLKFNRFFFCSRYATSVNLMPMVHLSRHIVSRKHFKKNLTSQSTKNGSLHAQEAPGGVVLCFEGQVRIFARSLLPARLVLRCFGGYKPLKIRTSKKLPNSRNKSFASPLSYHQGAGPDSKRLLQTVCQRALSSKPENPVRTSLSSFRRHRWRGSWANLWVI